MIFFQRVSIMARGGKRPGAGRPAGSANKDTAALRAALAGQLGGHVQTAIGTLAHIAANGSSEAARVSASVAILDRVYGRPAQALHHEGIEAAGPTLIRIVAAV
jgi:gamma-glutamyl-gamma-aminobutyrate hydrolase PuuD